MAQIVLIAEETLNKDINAIDDIVEIHDDDVALTGMGYYCYKVIKIEGMTACEIKNILNIKIPEQNIIEEKEVWKNDKGEWCNLINKPKYSLSFKNISDDERTSLIDKKTAVKDKITIINKVVEKIQLDTKNNVLVSDLNYKGV